MHLNEPELLVAFILEYFGEQSDLVIVAQIHLDGMYDRGGPLDYQRFEAVLLVEVGVHELLHGLDGQTALPAFLVVLYFLSLHIRDDVL